MPAHPSPIYGWSLYDTGDKNWGDSVNATFTSIENLIKALYDEQGGPRPPTSHHSTHEPGGSDAITSVPGATSALTGGVRLTGGLGGPGSTSTFPVLAGVVSSTGGTMTGALTATGVVVTGLGQTAFDKTPVGVPIVANWVSKTTIKPSHLKMCNDPWAAKRWRLSMSNLTRTCRVLLEEPSDGEAFAQVDWYIDDANLIAWNRRSAFPTPSGSAVSTQTSGPWALGGAASSGYLLGYNTTGLTDGLHKITAVVTYLSGRQDVVTDTTRVNNDWGDQGDWWAKGPGIWVQPAGVYVDYGTRSPNNSAGVCVLLAAVDGPVDHIGTSTLSGTGNIVCRGNHRWHSGVQITAGSNYTFEGDSSTETLFTNPPSQQLNYLKFRQDWGILETTLSRNSNLDFSTFGNGIQDGVQTNDGDSILARGQTDPTQNGPWLRSGTTWTQQSTASAKWSIVRIKKGTTYAGQSYINTSTNPAQSSWSIIPWNSHGLMVQGTSTALVSGIRLRNFNVEEVIEDGVWLAYTNDVLIENGRGSRDGDIGLGDGAGMAHSDLMQLGGANYNTRLRNLNWNGNIRAQSDFGPIHDFYFDGVDIYGHTTQVYGLEVISRKTSTSGRAYSKTDGVISNGSTTLTSATANFQSFTNADVNNWITGTGIPANTTIAAVVNSTTVTLSAAATANASVVTFSDGAISSGQTSLSSSTANFTSADIGRTVTGTGIQSSTTISVINSPTLVTLNKTTTGSAAGDLSFTVDRRISFSVSTPGEVLNLNFGTPDIEAPTRLWDFSYNSVNLLQGSNSTFTVNGTTPLASAGTIPNLIYNNPRSGSIDADIVPGNHLGFARRLQIPDMEGTVSRVIAPGARSWTNGVITSGSATLTSATASFTTYDVGRTVTATGIPAGTYVQTYNSATSVTLSAAATASSSSLSFVIDRGLRAGRPTSSGPGNIFAFFLDFSTDPGAVTMPATESKRAGNYTYLIDDSGSTYSPRRQMLAAYELMSLDPSKADLGSYYFTVSNPCIGSVRVHAISGGASPPFTFEDVTFNGVTGGTTITAPDAEADDDGRLVLRHVASFNGDISSETPPGPPYYAVAASANMLYLGRGRGTYDATRVLCKLDTVKLDAGTGTRYFWRIDSGLSGALGSPLNTYADGDITNGSTTLTSLTASFGTGDVGRIISGTGIPTGTKIAARVSATQVTLNTPATVDNHGALTFSLQRSTSWEELHPVDGYATTNGVTSLTAYQPEATLNRKGPQGTVAFDMASGFAGHMAMTAVIKPRWAKPQANDVQFPGLNAGNVSYDASPAVPCVTVQDAIEWVQQNAISGTVSTVRNGTTVPSAGLGNDGDFYIRTSTSQIYGPKTSGAWGSATSLLGSSGTNGNAIRSGSGVPSSGLGADGDFYFRTDTSSIYGPKASGAWGSGTSLAGTNGNTILSGSGVPSSGLGANGDFYFRTDNSSIYGPKAAGAWGSATSLIGAAGTNGNSVLNGSGTPSSGTGNNGDFYLDTTNHLIYGPKASGAWGSGTSYIGGTGAAGGYGMVMPTGAVAETNPGRGVASTTTINTSGLCRGASVTLYAGQVITWIAFMNSGSSSALTNCWFALTDASGNVRGKTADYGSATWSATTVRQANLATPYTVPTTATYYLHQVAAGTLPTMMAISGSSALLGLAPARSWVTSATYTDPTSMGSSITNVGGTGILLYGWCG